MCTVFTFQLLLIQGERVDLPSFLRIQYRVVWLMIEYWVFFHFFLSTKVLGKWGAWWGMYWCYVCYSLDVKGLLGHWCLFRRTAGDELRVYLGGARSSGAPLSLSRQLWLCQCLCVLHFDGTDHICCMRRWRGTAVSMRHLLSVCCYCSLDLLLTVNTRGCHAWERWLLVATKKKVFILLGSWRWGVSFSMLKYYK